MGVALRLMSIFSIVVGFIIVFSLINHQLIERKKRFIPFKNDWPWTKKQRKMIFIEFVGIVALSGVGGTLFGQILGQIISYKMFYQLGAFDFVSAGKIIVLLLLSTTMIITVALRQTRN